jgi:hypothetical protein
MTPDILLAISKSLAGVPGLAPIFNPLIALREEEKTERANAVLLAKLTEGEKITRDALGTLFAEVLDARAENHVIHEQIVSGFYAVLTLLNTQQMHSQCGPRIEKSTLLSGSTLEMQQGITDLLEQNQALLSREGVLTREAVQEEIVRLFSGNVKMLLAIVDAVGFPRGFVPVDVPPIQAYHAFLQTCDGLSKKQRARIAKALALKMPGSKVLDTWAKLSGYSRDEIVS